MKAQWHWIMNPMDSDVTQFFRGGCPYLTGTGGARYIMRLNAYFRVPPKEFTRGKDVADRSVAVFVRHQR